MDEGLQDDCRQHIDSTKGAEKPVIYAFCVPSMCCLSAEKDFASDRIRIFSPDFQLGFYLLVAF